MKDETEMMLVKVAYSVTFRVGFLETEMGVFQNATVTANDSNVFYIDRKDNIKNHVVDQLQKASISEEDEIIDVRILRTIEVD